MWKWRLLSLLTCVALLCGLLCGCNRIADDSFEGQDEPLVTEKHVVTEEAMDNAFLSLEYKAGIYTMNVADVLSRCAKYSGDYYPYEEKKYEYMTESQIYEFEQSGDTIDNAYILTIDGAILYNPSISYYYTEDKNLLTYLMVFSEQDELINYMLVDCCDEFNTCALLLATRGY